MSAEHNYQIRWASELDGSFRDIVIATREWMTITRAKRCQSVGKEAASETSKTRADRLPNRMRLLQSVAMTHKPFAPHQIR
jgi:hypothetical protein